VNPDWVISQLVGQERKGGKVKAWESGYLGYPNKGPCGGKNKNLPNQKKQAHTPTGGEVSHEEEC